MFLHKNGASGWTKHNCFCFCFGWPLEPPPPGVGQLCRTLGTSRPAASLGRPGGPEWAQFVLIPYSLAGTALRPSWKGDTKRVPAILGSVGGPCRERVWPNTRPARRLKDRPRGLPDLLRSGSKCHISFITFNFFLNEAVREGPGTLVATTIGPRPLGSLALLPSQGAGGQRAFSRPQYANLWLPLRTMTHGVHFFPPP